MVKKWTLRTGRNLLVILGLITAAILALFTLGNIRFHQQYSLDIQTPTIPENTDALARGRHLVENVAHCTYCHGPDLGGEVLVDDPGLGTVVAPNLTAGAGGLAGRYESADWVRTLRHGVTPTGRTVILMPSRFLTALGQDDLAAVIAYLQTIPPVDHELPETKLGPMAYVMIGAGPFMEALSAPHIDHTQPPERAPTERPSAAYGAYLVEVGQCRGCHGLELAGGQSGRSNPIGPNLTPGGELVGWNSTDFFELMRTGIHPTGRSIDPYMPWEHFQNMSDTELEAIWAFLQTLPALESQAP
jgi:mono/diheme cytochrome c family protein